MVGPVYGLEVGLSPEDIALFLAAYVLGGALAQYPIGWLADRFDRRSVLVGLSVGIADRPIADIPGTLRQDGSPPLYYLLLHGWMRLFGRGETATHLMSLVVALATIPLAYWVAKRSFGTRAGWACAVIAATVPFLTRYAQETRMYALVALLSVLVTASFLHAFAFRRRRYVPLFAVLLALLLYTHYWALFIALGGVAALGALIALSSPRDRPKLGLDGALAFGFAGLAFGFWGPTLAFQIEHTGAPWSNPPPAGALVAALALAVAAAVAPVLGEDATEGRALRHGAAVGQVEFHRKGSAVRVASARNFGHGGAGDGRLAGTHGNLRA